MGKLKDLHVERVDGVDKPATGKSFIIVKREDQTVDALAKATVEAILAGDVALSEDAASALGDLAKALELDVEVKASEAPAEPEPNAKAEPTEPAEPAAAAEPKDEPVAKDEEFVDVEIDGKPGKVAKSVLSDLLAEAIAEVNGGDAGEPKSESIFRGAGSTRARSQDEIEKSGEPKGLHTSWVFQDLK